MKNLIKITLMTLCVTALCLPVIAQKYTTRTGRISFFSSTPAEDIKAINNEVAATLDAETGTVSFVVPVKSFRFEKKLMQDHFNENYMESDKYPKANFSGHIRNPESVSFSRDGSYPVTAEGTLTMHGVSREVTIPGTVIVANGVITLQSDFPVKPEDYKIKIPSLVASKIAREIKVTVNTILKAK